VFKLGDIQPEPSGTEARTKPTPKPLTQAVRLTLRSPQNQKAGWLGQTNGARNAIRSPSLLPEKEFMTMAFDINDYIFLDDENNIILDSGLRDDEAAETRCTQLMREHKKTVSCYRLVSVSDTETTPRADELRIGADDAGHSEALCDCNAYHNFQEVAINHCFACDKPLHS